jgi:hypothetical protein
MATSGSTNYTQNRNEIILDAFRLLNVYGIGRTVSAENMTFANSLLNKMIKAWQSKGIHLWSMEEGVLFVSANNGTYDLASSTVKAASWDDTIITQLSSDHSTSATTLVVNSTTGMVAADKIGVVLADNTVHWTTIVSVDSSTGLTITSGLASAASTNANVYTYTNTIGRPLKIHNCRRVSGVDSSTTNSAAVEIPMRQLSQSEYDVMPIKGANGAPVDYTYTPNVDYTTLNLWPRPDNVSYYFRFRYSRLIEDLDYATDNFDFPSEWLETITYQLAARLATPFGKTELASGLIIPMASSMLEDMLNYDNEVASVSFSPEIQ